MCQMAINAMEVKRGKRNSLGKWRWDCSDRVAREGLSKKMKGLKERRVGAKWRSEERQFINRP